MSSLRGKRRRILALGVFLLGALLLLSCQAAQPAPTSKSTEKPGASTTAATTLTKPAEKATEKPRRGGTLRIATTTDPDTLDPNVSTMASTKWPPYDALVGQDKDLNVTKEGLFKDWTIAGDGKSITFKLQEGVKFQDGTDFDASAVKFNIDRMKDPANKSPYRSAYATVDSVEVLDSTTVRFKLSQGDALMITQMGYQAGMMVSPSAVKKYGQDFGRHPVGTGPFQFVEWVPGDRVVFKRFDGYWKKDKDGTRLPYLDGVTFNVLPDATVAFANLRTGQVDVSGGVSGLTVEQLQLLKGDSNLTYSTREASYITGGIGMNTKRPPFDNKALRQAVALAVDRQGLADSMGDVARAHASLFALVARDYDDGKAAIYPTRDLAKAKAKMAEAGYPAGGLKVTMIANTSAYSKWVPEVTQANLKEIGIEVDIEVLGGASYTAKAFDERNYQIGTYTQGMGVSDPGYIWGLYYTSQGTRNYFGYSNPQVDQFLDKARGIYDQKERAALYQQAGKIIADDVPFIPLRVQNWFVGINNKVRNFVLYPDNFERPAEFWLAQ